MAYGVVHRFPGGTREQYEASLAKVHEVMPSVDIVLFGENIGTMALPFPYRSAGVVTDRDELARLYSGARVHFDGSEFQAFGLPALEAMACGAVSVLTDVGGVQEYARHDENCLLVAPYPEQHAAQLAPGDLLFWTGTYNIERDPPITHAMIYLGREKSTNHRIMIGASDGRTYRGESRYGVSVFDFKISAPALTNEGRLSPTFVGYGHIPSLR